MVSRVIVRVAAAALALGAVAASAADLKVEEVQVGTGAEAVRHARVSVHYVGRLADGSTFDSSRDRGEPFSFVLGLGQVIRGWEQGLEGMRVGGRRHLLIPPRLGYGSRGAGDKIPPDATLDFDIELLAVEPPKYRNVDVAGLEKLRARGVRVIDLRRQDEWRDTGVIEGATLLTGFDGRGRLVPTFPRDIAAVADTGQPVALICRSGNRSSTMSYLLTERAGYQQVYNVTGGMNAWQAAGRKVVPAPR